MCITVLAQQSGKQLTNEDFVEKEEKDNQIDQVQKGAANNNNMITTEKLMTINNKINAEKFLGSWNNVDENTSHLTRLTISKTGGEWKIKAWGKCHPTDCEWGEVGLALFGTTVIDKTAETGMATWNFTIATSFVALKIEGDKLLVQKYSIFKDNSGRSNYKVDLTMKRSEDKGK